MVHSNRPQVVPTDSRPPEKRAADLRLYLERLIEHLDDTSLQATLRLMTREARGAVRRQEGLIALERLDGRDTAERMDLLRELRRVQDQLAAYCRGIEAGDSLTADAEDNSLEAATEPLSCSFPKFPLMNPQEREAHVGRIPPARLQAEPACAEAPAVGHRQGRHRARASC